ncbi:MAG: ABC transporter permease [Actinomycetes bacterium]
MSSVEASAQTPLVARARHRGALARQVRSEFRLVFRRRRNALILMFVALVPIFIGTAVKVSTPKSGDGPPFIFQVSGNGLFLVFTALAVGLPVFLPMAIAIVAGDAIAGEAGSGTLRYLLTVPVARSRVLLVKAIGVLTYAAAAVAIIGVVGLISGAAFFGIHPVTLLSGDTVSVGNGLLRALGVAVYVFIDLVGLVAIGMFLSTLTEVPVAAMAATLGVAIVFAILDSIPQVGSVRSILLTHHWQDFGELLRQPPHLSTLLPGIFLPLAYAAIFGTAAWARITTMDVTA